MAFFMVLRSLFNDEESVKYLKEKEDLFVKAEKAITELSEKKRHLKKELAHATMEKVTLLKFAEDVAYKTRYRKELELLLDELSMSMQKLDHLFASVPWNMLQKNFQVEDMEIAQRNARLSTEMQEVYEAMGKRQILVELRQEQQKGARLVELSEAAQREVTNEIRKAQSTLDSNVEKRNRLIVELVAGSKRLEVLRSKARQKSFEENKSIQNRSSDGKTVPLFCSALEKILWELENATGEQMREPRKSAELSDLSSEMELEPNNTSLSFLEKFGALNFENLDVDDVESDQEDIELKKSLLNAKLVQPKKPKRVRIQSPESKGRNRWTTSHKIQETLDFTDTTRSQVGKSGKDKPKLNSKVENEEPNKSNAKSRFFTDFNLSEKESSEAVEGPIKIDHHPNTSSNSFAMGSIFFDLFKKPDPKSSSRGEFLQFKTTAHKSNSDEILSNESDFFDIPDPR